MALKKQHVSAFIHPSGYWEQPFPADQGLLHSAGDIEYLGSSSSSFTGHLREMKIFSDSSLVSFAPTPTAGIYLYSIHAATITIYFNKDFASCQSGCDYGIGLGTLLNVDAATTPFCLMIDSAPTCSGATALFADTNECYSNISRLIEKILRLSYF